MTQGKVTDNKVPVSERLRADAAAWDLATVDGAEETRALEREAADELDNVMADRALILKAYEARTHDIECLRTRAAAWREFAEHQEHCATCANAVDDCDTGSTLRSHARSQQDG